MGPGKQSNKPANERTKKKQTNERRNKKKITKTTKQRKNNEQPQNHRKLTPNQKIEARFSRKWSQKWSQEEQNAPKMKPRGAKNRSGSRKMAQDSARQRQRAAQEAQPGLWCKASVTIFSSILVDFGLHLCSLALSGAVLGHLARSASICCPSWLHFWSCCSS